MSDTTAVRDEVAIAALDQRYASLRLVSPEELGRVRTSIERVGFLSPVLVATGVETAQMVLVDGFKRVRIAADRGDQVMWVRRAALDATGAKVAMVTANAGHSGLCDLEEAWNADRDNSRRRSDRLLRERGRRRAHAGPRARAVREALRLLPPLRRAVAIPAELVTLQPRVRRAASSGEHQVRGRLLVE